MLSDHTLRFAALSLRARTPTRREAAKGFGCEHIWIRSADIARRPQQDTHRDGDTYRISRVPTTPTPTSIGREHRTLSPFGQERVSKRNGMRNGMRPCGMCARLPSRMVPQGGRFAATGTSSARSRARTRRPIVREQKSSAASSDASDLGSARGHGGGQRRRRGRGAPRVGGASLVAAGAGVARSGEQQ